MNQLYKDWWSSPNYTSVNMLQHTLFFPSILAAWLTYIIKILLATSAWLFLGDATFRTPTHLFFHQKHNFYALIQPEKGCLGLWTMFGHPGDAPSARLLGFLEKNNLCQATRQTLISRDPRSPDLGLATGMVFEPVLFHIQTPEIGALNSPLV